VGQAGWARAGRHFIPLISPRNGRFWGNFLYVVEMQQVAQNAGWIFNSTNSKRYEVNFIPFSKGVKFL
jgi:hypothetical protein